MKTRGTRKTGLFPPGRPRCARRPWTGLEPLENRVLLSVVAGGDAGLNSFSAPPAASSYGYWVPFVESNVAGPSGTNNYLAITAITNGTQVVVDFDNDGVPNATKVLNAGETMTLTGVNNTAQFTDSTAGLLPGARVVTTFPVVTTYTYSMLDYGRYEDGFLSYALPTDATVGTDYILPVNANDTGVTATANNTQLQVDTNGDAIADQTLVLQFGQTVDLTGLPAGTRLTASNPIAVVAAVYSAGYYDNTYALTLLPQSLWQSHYVVPSEHPYSYASPVDQSRVLIIAAQNGTQVDAAGQSYACDRGQVLSIPLTTGAEIQSSGPIYAVYVCDIEGTDPWAGVRRNYAYAFNVPGAATAVTEVAVEFGATNSHGGPYDRLAVAGFNDNTQVFIDLNLDGSIDQTLSVNSGGVLYLDDGDPLYQNIKIGITANSPVGIVYSFRGWWGGKSESTMANDFLPSGASPHLQFIQQPANTMIGDHLSPPITVAVEDKQGNIVSSDTSSVTLAIVGGPAGATIDGVTTVPTVNGVATFSNLSFDLAGDYTLRATDGTLSAAYSGTFTISIPTNGGHGGTLLMKSGTGTFQGVSHKNNVITVTAGAAINGEITLEANNLGPSSHIAPLISAPSWLDPETNWQLINSWIPSGVSTQIADVSLVAPSAPGVYHYIFAFQWEIGGDHVASGTNWTTNTNIWGDGNDIATLGQTQIAHAQRYGFTQDDWVLPSGHELLYVPVDAITINVTPAVASRLIFTEQPVSMIAGEQSGSSVTVNVVDDLGAVDTTNNSILTVSVAGRTLTTPVTDGVATFSVPALTIAGTYTLLATDGSLTSATSTEFTVTAGPPVQVAIVDQTPVTVAGQPVAPFVVTAHVQDAFGNLVDTDDRDIILTITGGVTTPNGPLTPITIAAVDGEAVFTIPSLTPTGTFTIKARAGDGTLKADSSTTILAANVSTAKATIADPATDAPLATFTLTGGGSAQVTVALDGGDPFFNIDIPSSGKNSTFTVTRAAKSGVPAGTPIVLRDITIGGNDQASVSAPSPLAARALPAGMTAVRAAATAAAAGVQLKTFTAKDGVLVGTFEIHGGIQTITIGALSKGLIKINAPPAGVAVAPLTLSFPVDIEDGSIDSEVPIKSLSTPQWSDYDGVPDFIRAPWLGALTVKGNKTYGLAGNFGADVTLTGSQSLPAGVKSVLGSVNIAGTLNGAVWAVTGNIGNIKVGGAVTGVTISSTGNMGNVAIDELMDASRFVSGANIGTFVVGAMRDSTLAGGFTLTELPTTLPVSLTGSASIASVTVKDADGKHGSNGFVNSLIYAVNIGTVTLKDVQTSNAGIPSGIAADTLGPYTRKDAAGKVVKKLAKLKDPIADADNDAPDDLVVEIV